ncbi:MAG: DUF1800 family protein [Saprospiraceae bacterium]
MWLDKYTGPWNINNANYLLDRLTYTKNKSKIEQVLNLGLEASVDLLFNNGLKYDQPIHYVFDGDPNAAVGESWVNTPSNNSIDKLRFERRRSLNGWIIGNFIESEFTILPKLIMFWHNHLPITSLNIPEFGYHYFDILRRNCKGDFRSLIEEITICPAMLRFLNGNTNIKGSSNENYARELLELFTIGRGEIAGEGDYTNYTEQDVVEIARALTGWKFRIKDDGEVTSYLNQNKHDTTNKQLSYRFDNVVIVNKNEEEYKTVIDIILQKKEVAYNIVRQLHIWFVGADITNDVEENVIIPLGDQLYSDNYQLESTLKKLFLSDYFFDSQRRGCMLLSPLDYVSKVLNTTETEFSETLIDKYYLWVFLYAAVRKIGQKILDVPSVAGWTAYFQAPLYYQIWINSVSLIERETLVKKLIKGVVYQDKSIKTDSLKLVNSLKNPTDINDLLEEMVSLFFTVTISDGQKTYLKQILIPGLPDFEWTVEYGIYLSTPNDEELEQSIRQKTDSLVFAMLTMAEFHLL